MVTTAIATCLHQQLLCVLSYSLHDWIKCLCIWSFLQSWIYWVVDFCTVRDWCDLMGHDLHYLAMCFEWYDQVFQSWCALSYHQVSWIYCIQYIFDYLTSNVELCSVYPLAWLLSPIFGIATAVLRPSSTLARIYVQYSRLASINNIVLILIMIQFFDYYYQAYFSIWPIIALTAGRTVQTLIIDVYIAHVEKMRYTRGWDGLQTSLFKTKDHKKMIVKTG